MGPYTYSRSWTCSTLMGSSLIYTDEPLAAPTAVVVTSMSATAAAVPWNRFIIALTPSWRTRLNLRRAMIMGRPSEFRRELHHTRVLVAVQRQFDSQRTPHSRR